MFDISFSELLVIAIVALVVIGPEKLPKVARTAGAFFGRLQRFVTQVKDEVNRETRFAELQTLQQEVQSGLRQGYGEIEQSILPTGSQVVAHDQDRDNIPEVTSSDEAVEVAATKKTRKPRQRKIAADVGSEAIEAVQLPAEHAEQPKLSADPQAELFAVAPDQKKPRRTRSHTTKKKDDATAESEQKPLA